MITGLKPYPAAKDSGVPWLGEVPEHWDIQRGKWLFRKMDRPVHESDEVVTCFRDGTVTLRKNRRVRGFTEALKEIGYQGIRRGDLIIHAMDAFAGAVGVSDSDGKGTPVYSVCEPGVNANSHYFAYAIREMARSQWIQALAKGIRERSTDFRFSDFGSQFLPVPPFSEQAAIVRFLDYADRRIRRYIRTKQTLIKLLEEQNGAVINRAVTRGLDPDVRLRPSGVEWLGRVPEHWEVRKVKHCLRGPLAYGVLKPDKHDGADAVPIIRIMDMSDGVIRRDHLEQISLRQDAEFSRTRVTAGDVLVSVVGTIGRSAVVPDSLGHANLSRALCRVQLNHLLLPEYFHVYCQSRAFMEQADSIPAGTAQRVLNLGDLRQFDVPLPPPQEQKEILRRVAHVTGALAKGVAAARHEITLLREYRTRLIADVVTGKLDVRQVAWRLPEEAEEIEPIDEVDDTDEGVDQAVDEAELEEVEV